MNERFLELPEERRAAIINGALSVFARYDYAKASTESIAKAAGISKALLFHYFGSKRELYLHLYKYAENFFVQSMSQYHNYAATDFFEIMADAQACKIRILSVHPNLMEFLTKCYLEKDPQVAGELNHNFAAIIEQSSERFLARVDASKFVDGVEPRQVLDIVLWMADGYMRAQTPSALADLDRLNSTYLAYLDLLKSRFYKPEYL